MISSLQFLVKELANFSQSMLTTLMLLATNFAIHSSSLALPMDEIWLTYIVKDEKAEGLNLSKNNGIQQGELFVHICFGLIPDEAKATSALKMEDSLNIVVPSSGVT